MAILVGIDEAGYGPILGPLVVSAAAFEVPTEQLRCELWDLLRRSVCRSAKGANGRIIINDSKKLKQAKGGYDRLQRGVLACLRTVSENAPGTFGELLVALDTKLDGELDAYPWYADADGRALSYEADDIATAAAALRGEAAESGVRLRALWARPLPAGHFNRMIDVVHNKATVSFTVASGLIDQAYRTYGGEELHFVIDKQGGRSHYRKQLQRIFPYLELKILKETDVTSSYMLSDPARAGHAMRVHFLAKGETRQMPIALASMTSKYLRELFMEQLNAYFRGRYRELKPTAGYYTDGKRFLKDLAGFDGHVVEGCREMLVRKK